MTSTDRDALLALFHSTGGAHWTRKDNWGSDADLSQWEGIEKVNADGRVVKLSLWGNGLQGIFPDITRRWPAIRFVCPPPHGGL